MWLSQLGCHVESEISRVVQLFVAEFETIGGACLD